MPNSRRLISFKAIASSVLAEYSLAAHRFGCNALSHSKIQMACLAWASLLTRQLQIPILGAGENHYFWEVNVL